jgi:hypothetical protein
MGRPPGREAAGPLFSAGLFVYVLGDDGIKSGVKYTVKFSEMWRLSSIFSKRKTRMKGDQKLATKRAQGSTGESDPKKILIN